MRSARLRLLKDKINENPFLTDEELAQVFGVSVQTIRLDRMALGIPELRQRTRAMAERAHGVVRSLGTREIVGEIVDIELNTSGVSIMETTEAMALEKTGIIRGHHIFAQADSLAIAIIDSDVVLTGLANSKFKRPVRVGERLVAKAEVVRKIHGSDYVVQVVTRVGEEQVFRGKFVVSTKAAPAGVEGGRGMETEVGPGASQGGD